MEIWKHVVGHENKYEVSNFGNVRTVTKKVSCHKKHMRTVHGKVMKLTLKSIGYYQVGISNNGVSKSALVHRLVAEAFIPNPLKKSQVNHKDGVKTNNNVDNLEWTTPQENTLHAYRSLGVNAWHKGNIGKNTPTAKSVIQMTLDGGVVKIWDCASDAVRECGFDSGCISRAARGIKPQHKGFRWLYG